MRRILALALLTGCGSNTAPMNCPAGETCSDMYPDMTFRGSQLGDEADRGPPLKLAVGGTQKIMVLASPSDTVGILSFRAASSGSQLTTGAPMPPNVTLLGNSQGQAYLRILDPSPSNNALFGRTLIDIVPVASVDLRPKTYQNDLADMEFAGDPLATWVMFGDRTDDIVVRLFDSSGSRLADEGVFLGVAGPPLSLAGQSNWDTVNVTAASNAASQGTLKIRTSDHVDRDQQIGIVTTVDQIIRVNATNATMDPSTPAKVGDMRTYCFRALSNNHLVAGVTWLFVSNATIQPTSQAKNCVTLTGTTAGAGLLTVNAENQPKTFNLTFTP